MEFEILLGIILILSSLDVYLTKVSIQKTQKILYHWYRGEGYESNIARILAMGESFLGEKNELIARILKKRGLETGVLIAMALTTTLFTGFFLFGMQALKLEIISFLQMGIVIGFWGGMLCMVNIHHLFNIKGYNEDLAGIVETR